MSRSCVGSTTWDSIAGDSVVASDGIRFFALSLIGRVARFFAGQENSHPVLVGIDIDQQGLNQQAQRNGKKCTSSTENRGPDDQRQEAKSGRESYRYADNPRLDNGLDDKVQYGVDHDDDNCGHDVVLEQARLLSAAPNR